MPKSKVTEVPGWLRETSYEQLFMRGQSQSILDRPGITLQLRAIARADDVSPVQRVLAFELLAAAGEPVDPVAASVYCAALPGGFSHNWWGMPGQYKERLGQRLVAFGEAARKCLTALLDDPRSLGYSGSEEPTLNALMKYRVCDLAAYFICDIAKLQYRDSRDIAERDRFIAGLKAQLTDP